MTPVNHHLHEIAQNRMRHLIAVLLCFILLFGLCQSAYSQEVRSDKSLKSYKLPPNLKKHLQDKYKDQIEGVTSDLQETPQGPRGHLNLHAKIKIKNVEADYNDTSGRARAIAQAFLKQEAELLGFADLSELHEVGVTNSGDQGQFYIIYYQRYIQDMPLDTAGIQIGINPDGSVGYLKASLVPAPSELYKAAAKKMITQEEAARLIEQDRKAQGLDSSDIMAWQFEKKAIVSPPYVVWQITTGRGSKEWNYTIDAITGEIVHKAKRKIIPD